MPRPGAGTTCAPGSCRQESGDGDEGVGASRARPRGARAASRQGRSIGGTGAARHSRRRRSRIRPASQGRGDRGAPGTSHPVGRRHLVAGIATFGARGRRREDPVRASPPARADLRFARRPAGRGAATDCRRQTSRGVRSPARAGHLRRGGEHARAQPRTDWNVRQLSPAPANDARYDWMSDGTISGGFSPAAMAEQRAATPDSMSGCVRIQKRSARIAANT